MTCHLGEWQPDHIPYWYRQCQEVFNGYKGRLCFHQGVLSTEEWLNNERDLCLHSLLVIDDLLDKGLHCWSDVSSSKGIVKVSLMFGTALRITIVVIISAFFDNLIQLIVNQLFRSIDTLVKHVSKVRIPSLQSVDIVVVYI